MIDPIMVMKYTKILADYFDVPLRGIDGTIPLRNIPIIQAIIEERYKRPAYEFVGLNIANACKHAGITFKTKYNEIPSLMNMSIMDAVQIMSFRN